MVPPEFGALRMALPFTMLLLQERRRINDCSVCQNIFHVRWPFISASLKSVVHPFVPCLYIFKPQKVLLSQDIQRLLREYPHFRCG
jgi:hypothetical protein